MALLVAIAKAQGATVLIIQEVGQAEAAEFFAAMGPGWHYDRVGLNCIGWLVSEWTWQASDPVNLSSFGQLQRTLMVVRLLDAAGRVLRFAGSHLATAASDLTAARAVIARATQAAEIGAALAVDPVPTILGADWNSRAATDHGASAPRVILGALGWQFDSTNLATDAKHGIDGTAANYGISLEASTVVDLGTASDHDGRLVVATTKD